MTEHAVGVNWKKSAQVVFRHRAGSLNFLKKDDEERQKRWALKKKKEEAKKRKSGTIEVVDHEELVTRNGKRYKKITTYIPYVDLT